MRTYRSLTAEVDMVNVEGEVFIRKFGGEFVHQSKFAPPTEKEALHRFNGCLYACTNKLDDSFYHSDGGHLSRLKKELSQIKNKIAEAHKKNAGIVNEAMKSYRQWVKE